MTEIEATIALVYGLRGAVKAAEHLPATTDNQKLVGYLKSAQAYLPSLLENTAALLGQEEEARRAESFEFGSFSRDKEAQIEGRRR